MSSQNNTGSLSADMREKLMQVRTALLHLHKSILDAERASYERQNGRIESPHAVLQLVMHDPFFGWFRPLSEILVRIDELLDADAAPSHESAGKEATTQQPVSDADGNAILRELRSLLLPSEQGEEFATRYHGVLQQEPDIILAHAKISQLLA